jgi:hypothetical protein
MELIKELPGTIISDGEGLNCDFVDCNKPGVVKNVHFICECPNGEIDWGICTLCEQHYRYIGNIWSVSQAIVVNMIRDCKIHGIHYKPCPKE